MPNVRGSSHAALHAYFIIGGGLPMNLIFIGQMSLITLLTASLDGCGTSMWSHRDTNPAIKDQVYTSGIFKSIIGSSRSVNTFATTASRRIVIVSEDTKGQGEITTCSEPSPDVGEAFGSAIADGFKITANDPHSGITGDLSNQYARAVATQIAPLLYRTQGLQVYRDGLHGLCIDKMNGWLGGHDKETIYLDQKTDLLNKAIDLIKAEFQVMEKVQEAFLQNTKAGIGIDTLQKIADVVKSSAVITAPVPPPSEKKKPAEPGSPASEPSK